jgi:ribosome-binding protein aMBF1 (putative translation factor)
MGKGTWGGTLGKFGLYCKEHEIDREEMAAAVRCTPSYISMFAHAKAVPGRECAVNIEIWTGIKFGEKNAFRVIDWPRERLAFEKKAA